MYFSNFLSVNKKSKSSFNSCIKPTSIGLPSVDSDEAGNDQNDKPLNHFWRQKQVSYEMPFFRRANVNWVIFKILCHLTSSIENQCLWQMV